MNYRLTLTGLWQTSKRKLNLMEVRNTKWGQIHTWNDLTYFWHLNWGIQPFQCIQEPTGFNNHSVDEEVFSWIHWNGWIPQLRCQKYVKSFHVCICPHLVFRTSIRFSFLLEVKESIKETSSSLISFYFFCIILLGLSWARHYTD